MKGISYALTGFLLPHACGVVVRNDSSEVLKRPLPWTKTVISKEPAKKPCSSNKQVDWRLRDPVNNAAINCGKPNS
ncbi:hypothetical protein [Luteibaculum oceani]|uniref:Uncharacterized protein n=1 Tax=Luteibaculum oceani TaxID=1294296 RepID=A0A5C6V8N2_9FLAO|nr:hypothetical protein [Luteibaculum oceani]TXC81387.1 hypothetical protein FRX97_05115 [Luteibaculum oceani]